MEKPFGVLRFGRRSKSAIIYSTRFTQNSRAPKSQRLKSLCDGGIGRSKHVGLLARSVRNARVALVPLTRACVDKVSPGVHLKSARVLPHSTTVRRALRRRPVLDTYRIRRTRYPLPPDDETKPYRFSQFHFQNTSKRWNIRVARVVFTDETVTIPSKRKGSHRHSVR